MDIKPLLLSIPSARRLLGGIGTTKIYQLLNRGDLEALFIDHKRLITMASVDAYLARLSQMPPATLGKRNRNLKYCGAADPAGKSEGTQEAV